MNKFSQRLAAFAVTGALVVAGVTLAAGAANADQVQGTITLYAKGSGIGGGTIDSTKVVTSGSSTTNPMFWGITINGICPAGFRDGANLAIFQAGTFMGGLAKSSDVSVDGGVAGQAGLKSSETGVAIDEVSTSGNQNNYVANKALDSITTPLATGAFELRYYCFADRTSPDYTNDKFYSLALTYNATNHTWSQPVPLTSTTTSITAGANQTAKTVTITATIKKASDSSATTATGTATVNQTAPTAATLGTATVSGGTASYTTAALAPGTYTFTVSYGGDSTYSGSTSGSATSTINGANTGSTNVTFTVDPGSAGGITLSNVPTSVDLGHATVSGGVLTASNQTAFAGITVTDNRSINSSAWSLTGQMGTFTNGTYTLAGKYLGWAPFVQSGPATAGAVVAANSPGLGSAAVLATAPVTSGSPVSMVGAALSVAIPTNSATGTYSGVLTITLA